MASPPLTEEELRRLRHGINNALTGLMTNLDLVEAGTTNADPDVRRAVRYAQESTDTLESQLTELFSCLNQVSGREPASEP